MAPLLLLFQVITVDLIIHTFIIVRLLKLERNNNIILLTKAV
jgi:hypothetical protein